ncbi:MAG: hypothetical protein AAFN93_08590 [Bacteroidota bacterium]
MNKRKLEDEVDKTLTSLDNVDRAKVKPFFYTRLSTKLTNEKVVNAGFRWQWAAAIIAFVLALNTYSFLSFWPSSTAEDEVEWLADEYGIGYQDLYTQDLEP